jgi:hypothetical protein
LPDGQRLFTSMLDGTGLLWDLGPGLQTKRSDAQQVSEADANKWWSDLANADVREAYGAVWHFIDSPLAMPSLINHLKEPTDADFEKARILIAQLGDNEFRIREKAQEQLEGMGASALQAIRDAQAKAGSPEVARRLETLAARFPMTDVPARTLRRLRAIEVLEKVNSIEARKFLTDLAANANSPGEKEEALVALERMKSAKVESSLMP